MQYSLKMKNIKLSGTQISQHTNLILNNAYKNHTE